MARARAMLVLLTAARAFSSHAAAVSASPAAAAAISASPAAAAAISASPAVASKASLAVAGACGRGSRPHRLGGYGALAAAKHFSSLATASSASPALHSKHIVGGDLEPMVVGGAPEPRGRPFRRLGYAALAAFAAAGIYMACAPDEIDLLEDGRERMLNFWLPRRPPSGKEVRAMTKMLRRVDRRMKKFMEMKNKEKEKFWSFLEDIIKKGQTLLSAGNLLKDVYAFVAATVAGSIILIEKLGDPVQYFVCPYSGYTDVVGVFLFTVTPKGETHQGKGAGGSTTLGINNVSFFAGLEAMGITLRQMDLQIGIKIGIMPELEGVGVKIKCENFSWGKRLILEKGSSWGEKMITQQKSFGRHFEMEDELVSHITRRSIDLLKANYRDELSLDDWKLVAKLKKSFGRHFEMEDELVSHITRRSIDLLKANYRDELSLDDWKLVAKLKKILNIP